MNTLKICISIDEDGVMSVAFPDAEVIETDHGSMMGFRCSINSAMWIGGFIISAAVSSAGVEVQDLEGEETDE